MIQVLDLVPWREFSQSEFLEFVVPSDVLSQVSADMSLLELYVVMPIVASMMMFCDNLVMIVMIVVIAVGCAHCIVFIFKDMLVPASLAVMAEAVANPERITKYAIANMLSLSLTDPTFNNHPTPSPRLAKKNLICTFPQSE